jgi:AcrR family transcriptional regulator
MPQVKSASPSEKWALPAQQARSRATRERLVVTAERVFAEKGYDGAKLSDIAQAAGCSVGAVYFRFKDKDALFFAIAETFAAESRAHFAEFAAPAADREPDEIVRNYVLRVAASLRRHRGLFRAIIERGLEHPDVMRTIFAFREEVAEALDRALQAKHAKRRKDVSAAIRVMTQMVYGFLLVGILNPSAPTRLDDQTAIAGLAEAAVAHLKTVLA